MSLKLIRPLQVQRVVERRAGRMQLDEAVERGQRLRPARRPCSARRPARAAPAAPAACRRRGLRALEQRRSPCRSCRCQSRPWPLHTIRSGVQLGGLVLRRRAAEPPARAQRHTGQARRHDRSISHRSMPAADRLETERGMIIASARLAMAEAPSMRRRRGRGRRSADSRAGAARGRRRPARPAPRQGAGRELAPEFSRSHLQALIDGRPRAVDGRRAGATASHRVRAGAAHRRRAACRPPRAGPSGPSRWRWPSSSRTSTCWCSTSRPGWWCTRRRATGRAPCSTACWRPPRRRGAAAARRHRAPPGQGHPGLMVVGKTLPAVTALVRAIAAREVHRQYLALAHGGLGGPRSARSRRRSAATRRRACAWRWCDLAASRRAPTSSVLASARGAQRLCAARCTPAARTRSACTWPRAAIRWWPTRSTAARRRWAWRARPCTRPAGASSIRRRARRCRSMRAAARSGRGVAAGDARGLSARGRYNAPHLVQRAARPRAPRLRQRIAVAFESRSPSSQAGPERCQPRPARRGQPPMTARRPAGAALDDEPDSPAPRAPGRTTGP